MVLQIDTLREIQRLYDELVESAESCHLYRNSNSVKTRRLILIFLIKVI